MKNFNLIDSVKIVPFYSFPHIKSIFELPYSDRAVIENYQLSKLKKLIDFAYNNINLYKEKYDKVGVTVKDINKLEDIKFLPFITKEEILENFPNNVLPKSININECIVSQSSGSTGKVLKVIYDKSTFAKYMLAGLRTYQMGLNWKPWYRQLSIYTSKHPLDSMLSFYWLRFISTLEPLEKITNEMLNYKPHFISCYPSRLKEIKLFMAERKISSPPSLKTIFLNSEKTNTHDLKRFGEFFNCNIYDEYSSEELNRIASQCIYHNYHIFEDMNIIEIIDSKGNSINDGGIGEVIGTNLANFCMPLIRYKQGDLASIKSSLKCPCKRKFQILQDLEGRMNDHFILPSGKLLSSGFLLDLTYSILLDEEDSINDFCLIQKSRNKIVFEFIPGLKYNENIKSKIHKKLMQHILEDVVLEVNQTDYLSKTISGKQNPIICEIRNDNDKNNI